MSSDPTSSTSPAEHDSTRVLCPNCGYDLRGSAGERCPECGDSYDITSIVPTAPARAVDWFQAEGRFARLRAAWRMAWFPAKAVSAGEHRPSFEGLGFALHKQVLLLHALLFVGVIAVWFIVELLMGMPIVGLTTMVRSIAFSAIWQAVKVLLLMAIAMTVAWAYCRMADKARSSDEIVGLAGIIFSWSLAAIVIEETAVLAYFPLDMHELLSEAVRFSLYGHWITNAAWVLVPSLRYCLMGAFMCRGLRALPNRRWRATVLLPTLCCSVTAIVGTYTWIAFNRLSVILGLTSDG